MNDFETILSAIEGLPIGTYIPKPKSSDSSKVYGWGQRRGEKALVYAMPNHSKRERPHKKGVTVSELRQAYDQIATTGEFTRAWFNERMPDCSKEGACNYTTIGGVLELVGVAKYDGPSVYRAR